jgi:hypothetical protein
MDVIAHALWTTGAGSTDRWKLRIFAPISCGRLILGFDGIRWENGWFLAVNYGARILDFTYL